MTRAEFKALTDEMVAAHAEYFGFMKQFVQSVVTAATQRSKVMTGQDLEKARHLRDRLSDVEKRWFDFMRSTEPFED